MKTSLFYAVEVVMSGPKPLTPEAVAQVKKHVQEHSTHAFNIHLGTDEWHSKSITVKPGGDPVPHATRVVEFHCKLRLPADEQVRKENEHRLNNFLRTMMPEADEVQVACDAVAAPVGDITPDGRS